MSISVIAPFMIESLLKSKAGSLMTHNGSTKTKPARKAPPPISRYSAQLFAGLAKQTRFVDPSLATHWSAIAGRDLSGLCRPGRLTGGRTGRTLEVYAPNASAAAKVQFHADVLREKVNGHLGPGAVDRIVVHHREGQSQKDAKQSLGLSRFRRGG